MATSAFAHLLDQGCRAYAQRQFFLAHELWEEAWRNTPRAAPERASIQALVQIAVALHKLDAGRPDVALRLLGRAFGKLDPTASESLGIDLAQVRHDTRGGLDALAEQGANPTTPATGERLGIRIAMTRATEPMP